MYRKPTLAISCALGLLLASTSCSKDKSEKAPAADDKANQANQANQAAAVEKPAPAPAKKAAVALDGKSYGDPITQSESVSIDKLLGDPGAYADKPVRVEGMVTDVCPKRGCWFEMAGEKPGQKMRFKVQDGVMTFPMTAKGKYAVAEGVVKLQKLSLEESKKYAEYQAREYGKDIDPESITEPMTIVRLDGKGAVIRDSK